VADEENRSHYRENGDRIGLPQVGLGHPVGQAHDGAGLDPGQASDDLIVSDGNEELTDPD